MEKIILWGTGIVATRIYDKIKENIVAVVDNNSEKTGTKWKDFIVCSPQDLFGQGLEWDCVLIATVQWKAVSEQIINDYGISSSKIENGYFIHKKRLLDFYEKQSKICDDEVKECLEYLKENPLENFNYEYTKEYLKKKVDVFFDDSKKLFYVYHCDKKMYFSKTYKSVDSVRQYYQGILLEQDEKSPHRYMTDDFCVKQGDIVLDGGVAEGNFALEVIDLVEKIYLVEVDEDWIEALEATFEPYKEKVEIVKAFLSDNNENGNITIDKIIGDDKLDFIKLDIEGAEVSALNGAINCLEKQELRLALCAYHKETDEGDIKSILNDYRYNYETTPGYMVFFDPELMKREEHIPKFVRGIVRGSKII